MRTAIRSQVIMRTLLVALCVLPACRDDGPTSPAMQTLEAAEAKWNALHRSSYAMEQSRDCFCAFRGKAYGLTIVGNVVRNAIDPVTGAEVPAEQLAQFRTVTQLFAEIRSAMRTAGATVDVEYDPDTGIPSRVWIDPNPGLADEEYGYHSGNIHVLID